MEKVNKGIDAATLDRMSLALRILGIPEKDFEHIAPFDSNEFTRFHLTSEKFPQLPPNTGIVITMLADFIGVHDAKDMPGAIVRGFSEKLLNSPYGKDRDGIRKINGQLKEGMAIYTLEHGEVSGKDGPFILNDQEFAHGAFFAHYAYYACGHTNVLSVYEIKKAEPDDQEPQRQAA